MKLITFVLKELIEIIKILQFRCYFKFGMGLHKLACTNLTTMTIFSIAVICFKGSEEEGGIALYQCHDQVAPKSSNRAFKYLRLLSFMTYVFVRS